MAVNYSPRVVTDGLVLCLDAANPKSYSGTGTVWNDLSGNNNNGMLINGVGYSSSNGGNMVFDSINDYVDCGNNTALNLINAVSLEAWIKFTTTANTICIEKSNNNTHYQFQIFSPAQAPGGGVLVFMMQPSSSNWVVSDIPSNDNNWHHVVGTYERSVSTAKIYIDNVLRNTNTAILIGPSSNTQPLVMGSRSGASGFGGSIGNVKIYNRALTSQEIQQNFNSIRGRYNI